MSENKTSGVGSDKGDQSKFKVGDLVEFADEHGTPKRSNVTAIVPVGEYSSSEPGYAIKGHYGDYVRVASEITLVADERAEGVPLPPRWYRSPGIIRRGREADLRK